MWLLRQWCPLSMLHGTCDYMLSGIRLGGLSMPSGRSTLCMPIYFMPWGIKEYPVPYMVQIELTCISIKCGTVNPYVDGFLNCSGNVVVVPPYRWIHPFL